MEVAHASLPRRLSLSLHIAKIFLLTCVARGNACLPKSTVRTCSFNRSCLTLVAPHNLSNTLAASFLTILRHEVRGEFYPVHRDTNFQKQRRR
jgi:hypothetical protein